MILDRIKAPWAIRPTTYDLMWGIYERWTRGEAVPSFEKPVRAQAIEDRADSQYEAIIDNDGIATVAIVGPLSKKMNLVTDFSGGTSTQRLEAVVQKLGGMSECKAIIYMIDSPGGEVDGTMALAETLAAVREKKLTYAVVDGQMCSAAMWLGAAAAKQIFAVSRTCDIGSIGVVARHTDMSVRENMAGIKTTLITSGRYKAEPNPYQPLSTDGRAVLQDMVDKILQEFVSDVSTYRGMPKEKIAAVADGRVWMSVDAQERGLIDGIKKLSEVRLMIINALKQKGSTSGGGPAMETVTGTVQANTTDTDTVVMTTASTGTALLEDPQPEGGFTMDKDMVNDLASARAEVIAAQKENETLRAAAAEHEKQLAAKDAAHAAEMEKALAAKDAQHQKDMEKALADERERVRGILAVGAAYPDHKEAISQCIAEGLTAGDTALKMLKVRGEAATATLARQDLDAPQVVSGVHSTSTPSESQDSFDKQAEQYMKDHNCSYEDACLEISKRTKADERDF